MSIPNPVTRKDHYLNNIDKAINGEALIEAPAPVTREDHYLVNIGKALAGEALDTAPDPVTRVDHYLDKISKDVKAPVEVESLTVTENDTYTAPSGKAYSPVIVNVPTGGGDPEYYTATLLADMEANETVCTLPNGADASKIYAAGQSGEYSAEAGLGVVMVSNTSLLLFYADSLGMASAYVNLQYNAQRNAYVGQYFDQAYPETIKLYHT